MHSAHIPRSLLQGESIQFNLIKVPWWASKGAARAKGDPVVRQNGVKRFRKYTANSEWKNVNSFSDNPFA
jgi:hypothetical protein